MALFGTFGIRGIVNRNLTSELALKMGMSFATLVKDGAIVVGCDGRSSRCRDGSDPCRNVCNKNIEN